MHRDAVLAVFDFMEGSVCEIKNECLPEQQPRFVEVTSLSLIADTLFVEQRPKPRLSTKELVLLASPFPLLWLVLGLMVNPAVFVFWQPPKHMGPLSSVTLFFVPLGFTFFYSLFIYVSYRLNGSIGARSVIIHALVAFFLAFFLCPIP